MFECPAQPGKLRQAPITSSGALEMLDWQRMPMLFDFLRPPARGRSRHTSLK